jgi:protocatechuate 3,4-dioxygenase beta subunit
MVRLLEPSRFRHCAGLQCLLNGGLHMSRSYEPDRRYLLLAGAVGAAGMSFPPIAAGQELPPTPECRDEHDATPRQTEGPFFKPKSPQRADLREAATKGRVFELSGVVLTRGCRPVPGALVDLWHADENGDYDNRGFRYRGHQLADAQGRYPGRTRHYHVKVQAPSRAILTTQLYFPGDAQNERDGLFRRELLMRVAAAGEGLTGRFDFVLDMR